MDGSNNEFWPRTRVSLSVFVCAGLHSDEFNIYRHNHARNIANSSLGLVAAIVFTMTGLSALRCSSFVTAGSDVTQSLRIFKTFGAVSIVTALILALLSAYLAYLTSHHFGSFQWDEITIAHAALPFHVLHVLTAVMDMLVSIWGLTLSPVTKPLPSVAFKTRPLGIENPLYVTSKAQIWRTGLLICQVSWYHCTHE